MGEIRQMFWQNSRAGKGTEPPLWKDLWICWNKKTHIKMNHNHKSHTGQLRRSPVLFAACSNSPNMSDLSRSFLPNIRSTCWLCIKCIKTEIVLCCFFPFWKKSEIIYFLNNIEHSVHILHHHNLHTFNLYSCSPWLVININCFNLGYILQGWPNDHSQPWAVCNMITS